ncbi:MAG TPA: efflux RND transporter periplasmic adaptor subunit, partial [Bacteroidales bacterium]|nr:efflux RND transporter periplasmic adaptor subunit [Bacteroidales bacterium]
SYFDVEFNILEAEMTIGTFGQRVVVSPFIDEQKRYIGKITEVNPLIDAYGQITIRARIKNHDAWLVEGMNVRVVVESDMKDMFVVPKDAVVSRDGFYVVFRYQDSTAIWTYVDVLYANIDSYAISGCKAKQTRINEGDVIITSGNLNLADGTPVIPRAPKSNRP